MFRNLRYGLIGAGRNAERKHISGYSNVPNIEIVSICDVNKEKAKKVGSEYGIENVYDDYVEMIRKENLDIVSICTPNSLHAEIAIFALMNGVNVHCEKPLAINAKEAKRILDAKNKSGKKVMVGLNNRFTNEAVFLKDYIDKGFLGEIYQAKAGWIRRSGIPGRGTWFTNKELSGGGVMIDLGVHYLDLVLYLMGMPDPSYIMGSAVTNYDKTLSRDRPGYSRSINGIYNVEDSAVGFLNLMGGRTVSFEFSWAANIAEEKTFVELIGTKGGASLINGSLQIYSEINGTCVDISPKIDKNTFYKNEFEHFVNCIIFNEEPIAPAEHGVYMMDIVDHFYDSAKKKEPLFIGSCSQVLN
ncbi:Gfo/Idh/MocA family protein [Halalkalibacter alkaliphilus]|uniref:Gfo/Idh/MocA family oxidoreductase n=1 Tax=Halalkalibacter alkaliphilus TaxID=2917993 RepID=A0A9X2CUF5_9BACI|nr:Gfo/Idh/MocA family oxidoreductase [Halalkalibacter alkaliphilus]MCL7748468.1 Gfo/Idh/MocA family oxidoreductase [Halalkalibacter alkaliphilus]